MGHDNLQLFQYYSKHSTTQQMSEKVIKLWEIGLIWDRNMSTTKLTRTSSSSMDPHHVLVAYILRQFPVYSKLTEPDRIRIKFLFVLTAEKQITERQLIGIMASHYPFLMEAAEILVCVVHDPLRLCSKVENTSSKTNWGTFETIALLGAESFGGTLLNYLPSILPNRARTSWNQRIGRVAEQLQSEGAFRDETIYKDVQSQIDQASAPNPANHRHRQLERASAMHKERARKRKLARMKSRLALSRRKVRKLEDILLAVERDQVIDEDDQEQCVGSSSDVLHMSQAFLRECMELCTKSPNTRRFTEFLLQAGQVLHLTSPKCYRLLRQILPLPSPTTLWENFSSEFQILKTLLLDKEKIPERVEKILSLSSDTSPVISTIGVDAFSFRTFSALGTMVPEVPQEQSNAFLFVSIPLDVAQPVKLIHLEPKDKGCFDAEIDSVLQNVIQTYRRKGGHVWFIATDGDRYLNATHDAFFADHVVAHEKNFFLLINQLYDYVEQGNAIPIADPLHFGKNLRGKLLNHNVVSLAREGEACFTTAETLERILQLGDTLTDRSQIGRMRDYYVTTLFTLENVTKLLSCKAFDSALTILPCACVYTVLYADNLLNESRMFFIQLAYLAYLKLFRQAEKLVKMKNGISYRKASRGRGVTIAEPCYFRRMLNSCLGFGLALAYGPQFMRLDALGTHLVENMIGVARSLSNDSRFERIVSAFANSDMKQQMTQKMGLKIHIPKRINDGGAKIDTFETHGLRHPESWVADNIISMIIGRARGVSGTQKKEFKAFLRELQEFVCELQVQRLHHPSAVANALIVERNYKFASNKTESSRT